MKLRTATKEAITADLIAGIPQQQIADSHSVNQSTISRYKKQIQSIIDYYNYKLITGAADKSVDNTINTITKAHTILNDPTVTPERIDECKTLLYLSDRKEERVLKGLGIVDSHTGSPVVNNWILGDVTVNQVVDPGVQAALGSQLDVIMGTDDVTEAEYTDDMSNNDNDS